MSGGKKKEYLRVPGIPPSPSFRRSYEYTMKLAWGCVNELNVVETFEVIYYFFFLLFFFHLNNNLPLMAFLWAREVHRGVFRSEGVNEECDAKRRGTFVTFGIRTDTVPADRIHSKPRDLGVFFFSFVLKTIKKKNKKCTRIPSASADEIH